MEWLTLPDGRRVYGWSDGRTIHYTHVLMQPAPTCYVDSRGRQVCPR